MTKALKSTNLEQNCKTNTDRAAVSIEGENQRTTLMSLKTSAFAFDFNKVKQQFLQVELACLRFANQSKGKLVLTPITLHLDNQTIQTLSATSRQTGKGIACILHKHLSSSFKYHLKRVPLFHLAFGVAYEKGRDVAKRENINLLYHVHITALLTPKEADSRTREGRKAHKACKCLNKLPKSSAFEKQECRFATQSELKTFQTQYATYLQHGSRQRWSDYKASNVKSAIYRDKKEGNNYFQKPSDLFAGSRGLKGGNNQQAFDVEQHITDQQSLKAAKEAIVDKIIKDVEHKRRQAQLDEWNESTLPTANNDKNIDEMLNELFGNHCG